MRRAKLEGRHIGRDRAAIHRDRQQGHSLGQLAKSYLVSRTTIHRVLDEQIPAVTKGLEKPAA
jgi:predicted transcriptional regulator